MIQLTALRLLSLVLWGVCLLGSVNGQVTGFSRTWTPDASPRPYTAPVSGCELQEVTLLRSRSVDASPVPAGVPVNVDGASTVSFQPQLLTQSPPDKYHIATISATSNWLLYGRMPDAYQVNPSGQSQPSMNSVNSQGDCLMELQLDTADLQDTPCGQGNNSWLVAHLSYSTLFMDHLYPAQYPNQTWYPLYPWYPLSLKILGDGRQLDMVQDQVGDPSLLQISLWQGAERPQRIHIIVGTTSIPVLHPTIAAKDVMMQVSLACVGPSTLAPCPMSHINPGVDCSGQGQCVADPINMLTADGFRASRCQCRPGYEGTSCEETVIPLGIGTTAGQVQQRLWTRYKLNWKSKTASTVRIAASFGAYPRFTRAMDGAPFLLCVQQFKPTVPVKLVSLGTDVLLLGKACDVVGAVNGRDTQYMVLKLQPNTSVYVSLFGRDRHILPGSIYSPPVDGLLQASELAGYANGRTGRVSQSGTYILPAEVVRGYPVIIHVQMQSGNGTVLGSLDCPSPTATSNPCGDHGTCMKSDNTSDAHSWEQDRQYSWYNLQYLKYGVKTPGSYCQCEPGFAGEDCSKQQLDIYFVPETSRRMSYTLPASGSDLIINVVLPSSPTAPYLHVTTAPLACMSVSLPLSPPMDLNMMPAETEQLGGFVPRKWVEVGAKREEAPEKMYAHFRKAMTASIKIDDFAWSRGPDADMAERVITFTFSWANCAPSCWLKNPPPLGYDGKPAYGYSGAPRLSINSSLCPTVQEALGQEYDQWPVHLKFKLSNDLCADFPSDCHQRSLVFSLPWLSMTVSMGCGLILVMVGLLVMMKRRYRSYRGPDGQVPGLEQVVGEQPPAAMGLPRHLLDSYPTYTYKANAGADQTEGTAMTTGDKGLQMAASTAAMGKLGRHGQEEDVGMRTDQTAYLMCPMLPAGVPHLGGEVLDDTGGEANDQNVGRGHPVPPQGLTTPPEGEVHNNAPVHDAVYGVHPGLSYGSAAPAAEAAVQYPSRPFTPVSERGQAEAVSTRDLQQPHTQGDAQLLQGPSASLEMSAIISKPYHQAPHRVTATIMDHDATRADPTEPTGPHLHDVGFMLRPSGGTAGGDGMAGDGSETELHQGCPAVQRDSPSWRVGVMAGGNVRGASNKHVTGSAQDACTGEEDEATAHAIRSGGDENFSKLSAGGPAGVGGHGSMDAGKAAGACTSLSGQHALMAHATVSIEPAAVHSSIRDASHFVLTQTDGQPLHEQTSSSGHVGLWVSHPVQSLSKTMHMLTQLGWSQTSSAAHGTKGPHDDRAGGERKEEGNTNICMICLEEYLAGDVLMELPCSHSFHKDCITSWLRSRTTCPACRHALLPEDDKQDGDDGTPRPPNESASQTTRQPQSV